MSDSLIDLKVTFKGGKDFSKIDWRDGRYLQDVLPWAGEQIKRRFLTQGTTGDGRPLPPYGKRYAKKREKEGLPTSPVNFVRTGEMWASMFAHTTKKGQGEVGFEGTHSQRARRTKEGKELMGPQQEQRIGAGKLRLNKKTGQVEASRGRAFTNQALASILAFRERGKPMPNAPLSKQPRFPFMDLDQASCEELVRRFEPYSHELCDNAPPALKP